ncbi:MAG: WbqC family protein [Cytophagales bacterium]
MAIVTELHYFPSIPYFSSILHADEVLIESNENFQKQSYRNRCYVLSANGVLCLTVPIVKPETKQIRDIKIDYTQNWQQIHLRGIRAGYGNSAYFDYYYDGFEKIILSKKQFLFDLNIEIMTKCLSILKLEKPILFTDLYRLSYQSPDKDLRNQYSTEIIKPCETENNAIKYYQVFGNVFVKHLSIIDLLFNEGTNAKQYLYNL